MPELSEVYIRLEAGILRVESLSDNTQITITDVDAKTETIHRMTPDGRYQKAERNLCLRLIS